MTKAALYVPVGIDVDRWLHRLAAVAEYHEWEVRSLVRHWGELAMLLRRDEVQIGIVGSSDHLDPDREPRLEVVDQWRPPVTLPGQRRPTVRWPR